VAKALNHNYANDPRKFPAARGGRGAGARGGYSAPARGGGNRRRRRGRRRCRAARGGRIRCSQIPLPNRYTFHKNEEKAVSLWPFTE